MSVASRSLFYGFESIVHRTPLEGNGSHPISWGPALVSSNPGILTYWPDINMVPQNTTQIGELVFSYTDTSTMSWWLLLIARLPGQSSVEISTPDFTVASILHFQEHILGVCHFPLMVLITHKDPRDCWNDLSSSQDWSYCSSRHIEWVHARMPGGSSGFLWYLQEPFSF